MADEFLAFLAAGIFILVVGLLLVGATFDAKQQKESITVFESGFNISYLSQNEELDLPARKLENGLFFGSDEIRQHIEIQGIEKLIITFEVASTNNLAPLEITINDKVVERDEFAVGMHKIEIFPEFLSDSMDVEIRPMSSLWKIWAPTTYTIRNAQIEVRSLFFGKKEFTFLIGPDEDFDEARIEFVMEKNVGGLVVELNDKQIHSGFLKNEQSIDLSKGDLNRGENKLEIIPRANTAISGTARVVIFSGETKKKTEKSGSGSYEPLFSLQGLDP